MTRGARRPVAAPPATQSRCVWATASPELLRYHDREWGVPKHRDRDLFEFLVLEGAQAGLSWLTILRKRAGYRRAFAGFDAGEVARFTARDVARLMNDEGIVRNRAKIGSAIENARAFLRIRKEFGTFDRYVWRFVDKDELSRDLRRRGFRFVGPTICESFQQAVGIRNDHERDCFRRGALR